MPPAAVSCGMTQLRRALSDAERIDWLRLIRTENVGPVTFARLLERYDTATLALKALPDLARRGGRTAPLRICSKAEAEREIAAARKAEVRLIASCEPDYPLPLSMIEDAPPVIAVKGHAHLLGRRCIGMVGARNASTNGKRFADTMARELGAAGFVVVSGMARGIDTSAHLGSLDSGTVAVVAGGVDVIYPEENAALYARIAGQGAVVAECPMGTQPMARHFPRRNRIISGLSLGVVIIEATPKSGSLITARTAGEQGREVFAVPGSPIDPRAAGANDLIKQGATLVTEAADVINAVAPIMERPVMLGARENDEPLDFATDGGDRARIINLLGPSPISLDDLIRMADVSPAIVRAVLLELELAGKLERHGGGLVSMI